VEHELVKIFVKTSHQPLHPICSAESVFRFNARSAGEMWEAIFKKYLDLLSR